MDNFNIYIDELSHDRDVSIIYVDSSNYQTIITVPLDLIFFNSYSNVINQNIPEGYTNNSAKASSNYLIGISNIKASENHFKIYYLVAPLKQQSSITINYLLQDNIISSNTTTQNVGNIFNISQITDNIPSGYQFLEINSAIPVEYTYSDQIVDVELTKTLTTGSVEIMYEDKDTGDILSYSSITGSINSTFPLNTYETNVPNNYQFDSVNTELSTFTAGSNILIIYCTPATGTITIQYSNNGNIISSTSINGNVGSSLDISQYTNNIPSGYEYSSDNSSQVNTFQSNPQTLTINITPIPAPTPAPSPSLVDLEVSYYDYNTGQTLYSYHVKCGTDEVFSPQDLAVPQTYDGLELMPTGYEPGVNKPISCQSEIDQHVEQVAYQVTYYQPTASSSSNNNASSAADDSEASEEASIASSYSAAEKAASMSANPVPISYGPIGGSTKVKFNFINRGSVMVDPTFTLPNGTTTLHHILYLMKPIYADVNVGQGTFKATHGGTLFHTYDDPRQRKFNITPLSTSFNIHVYR